MALLIGVLVALGLALAGVGLRALYGVVSGAAEIGHQHDQADERWRK